MMNIQEISQYSHKIVKVDINNSNEKSSEDWVTVKIHLNKESNETIRFSVTKNPSSAGWLEHQSFEDDYFLRIPNKLQSITEIYAHYFPISLYDYTEPQNIYSIYDFSDFIKDEATNQWDGRQYPLQITSYGYEMLLGTDNKPLIRSLLKDSHTRYKDPNYKNYTQTDIVADMTEKGRFPLSSRYRNSLYRTAPTLNDKENFKLPYWRKDITQYSHGAQPTDTHEEDSIEEGYIYEDDTASNSYISQYGSTDNCSQRNAKIPFWEAKIHRSGLSPLINDTSGDNENYTPINIYLNYQYLPTSTEYHQHYFGLEGKNVKDKNGNTPEEMLTAVESYNPNGTYNETQTNINKEILKNYSNNIKNGTYKQLTSNKSYEILDGEGLNDINQAFGEDNVTYRIIRHGNPYDNSSSIYVNHKNVYNVNLNEDIGTMHNCLWDKNPCDKYYTYTPTGAGAAYIDVQLKKHTYYVLKYFMYIPAEAYIEDDSCYMEVQSRFKKGEDINIVGQLSDKFKEQDKRLRQEWIYHEIPFYTESTDNKIVIKGPQHNYDQTIGINYNTGEVIANLTEYDYDNPDIQLHDCTSDVIHFYSIQIAELVEYSPTLKYTKTGLYVVEGNDSAKKSLKEARNQSCISDINSTKKWDTQQALHPSDTWINKGTEQLPIPLTDVYIFFDDDFTIMYDKNTTELSYTKGDFPFTFAKFNKHFDEELKWISDDSIINLQYDRRTSPRNLAETDQTYTHRDNADTDFTQLFLGELRLFNSQKRIFTTGVNNSITLKLQDAYHKPVTKGKVECSIWTSNEADDMDCSDSERCLGIQTPDIDGIVTYQHLNFKKLEPNNNNYYLRIKYSETCSNKEIIKWKSLVFIDEYRNMEVFTNKCDNQVCFNTNACCQLVANSIFNNNSNKYIKQSWTHTITSVDEYPLRLDVKIRSQPLNNNPGNIIDEGYCELSVNDKVIQTTFVDSNGIADFYLDEADLDPGIQTVKIEYFTRPNEPVNYIYFPINCSTIDGYDERPAIPIKINKITKESVTQLTNNIYEIEKDDIFFVDVDIDGHTNFSITTIKEEDCNHTSSNTYKKTSEVKNIQDSLKENTIAAMYKGNEYDKYTFITGNIKDPITGGDITHQYRETKKSIIVKWINVPPKAFHMKGISDIFINDDYNLEKTFINEVHPITDNIELITDVKIMDSGDLLVEKIPILEELDLEGVIQDITIDTNTNSENYANLIITR